MPVERKLAKVVTKKVGKKDIKKDKKIEVRSNNTNVDNPKKGNSFLVIGIILISIAVILVILSLVYFNRSSKFAKIVKITNSNEIVSMYNDLKSITCYMTYSSGDEHGTSEMYVKKGMISQRTETTIDGEEFEMYALAKNDKLYTWGNIYHDGEGYYMTYEVDIKEELQLFDDADSGTIVNCKKGVDDNSVFKLPKNIKFELLDDYLDDSDSENTYNSIIVDDTEILHNFYKYINDLDYSKINAIVDNYLRDSDVFKTYFSKDRLTHFFGKISENGLSISNINLKSGDENSTRYYGYNVSYQLKKTGETIEEEREAAIVKRNNQYLIGSLQCITTGCSKMPFFQE